MGSAKRAVRYLIRKKSKTVILFLVFAVSSVSAVVIGNILAEKLKGVLFAGKSISTLAIEISPHLSDIGMLIMSGAMILFIGIGISVIPVLRTNPKDTLSDMEG